MKVFVNGKFYQKNKAVVSVFDHGFLYGDGVYETLRAYNKKMKTAKPLQCVSNTEGDYNGKIFLLDKHLKRLFQSAKFIHLKILYSKKYLSNAIYKTLKVNKLKDARIRLSVSRGIGPIGLDIGLCKKPTLVIIAEKFKPYPEKFYKNGVKLIVAKTRRNHPRALNPEIKSTNFLNNILAKYEAAKRGAFDSVMLNTDGFVTECTTSNIFLVKNGILKTPSLKSGILKGITRDFVIKLAKKLKIKVLETLIKSEELYNADEIFLTSTTMEIMPVGIVEDKKFKVLGKITKLLIKKFNQQKSEITE